MTKIWHVIQFEYKRHVFEKRFILSLLSLPVGIIAMVAVGLIVVVISIDTTPVGYIDHSGVLNDPLPRDISGTFVEPVIDFLPYQDEGKAQSDMEAERLQAYYVIPPTYPDSRQIQLIYLDEPGTGVQDQFNQFLRQNLGSFKDINPQIGQRLQEGSLITSSAMDGSREMREDQWFTIFTPFIAGIIFLIVVMTSGGYLLQAVVEEKENRTMEIMVTSVSPNQLMTGKIIGNIAVGLTQLIVWLIFVWIGLAIGREFFPFLQDFSLPTDFVVVMMVVLLPSFVMVAAIMAAIGATMTETQEAQQVSSIFSMTITIPFYVVTPIMMNPNGTLAMILSYIPLTAPITILMRMGFTVVPVWQIAINIFILVIFAVLGIWFAGKVFRMGMLRYGKKLSIKEVIGRRESQ